MLLPLANTLFTVKLGLSSTSSLAEASQSGCSNAGRVPPVTVGKEGGSSLPGTCCFPGPEQAGKAPGSMRRSGSQKLAQVHGSTSVSHLTPPRFWDITGINS